jgi:hypothetical protein
LFTAIEAAAGVDGWHRAQDRSDAREAEIEGPERFSRQDP